jgi:hypothetical protein
MSNSSIISDNLRYSLQRLHKLIRIEVFDVIKSLGYNEDEYELCLYPDVSLERIDGQPVDELLIKGIADRLRGE